jgi:hypothetical protein
LVRGGGGGYIISRVNVIIYSFILKYTESVLSSLSTLLAVSISMASSPLIKAHFRRLLKAFEDRRPESPLPIRRGLPYIAILILTVKMTHAQEKTRHRSLHINKSRFDFIMSSEADKIAQFQSITGAPESIARSFLESTSWDLQVPSSSCCYFVF